MKSHWKIRLKDGTVIDDARINHLYQDEAYVYLHEETKVLLREEEKIIGHLWWKRKIFLEIPLETNLKEWYVINKNAFLLATWIEV